MLTGIRNFFFNSLVNSAGKYLEKQDDASGRFLENGGWAVTLQDAVLAYAYLYTKRGDTNPFYGDEKIFNVILNGVQALRDFQYPDGQLEFVKTDGSKWGPIYMPWTFYHWLETYDLMKDFLPEKTRKDWEKGLLPAFQSFAESPNTYLHNITLWNSMSLHRAGIVFNREDWKSHGQMLFSIAVYEQHPDGYWEEHRGPTVSYNHVYSHALGLYRFHGGKVNVTETLRRTAAFHQAFTYPDGSIVETIDGRVKYHRTEKITSTMGFTGMLATVAGVKYLQKYLDCFSKDTISLPHTASLLIMLDGISDDFIDPYEGYPNYGDDKLDLIHGKGSVIRDGGRQIVLSSYTTPLQDSRWSLDRQSFVSLWDRKAGLLAGSGNSKYQPGYGSFVICGMDNEVISYSPHSGKHLSPNEIELSYYGATCSIKGEVSAEGVICLTFGAQLADPSLSWYINIPLRPIFDGRVAPLKEYKEKNNNVIEFSSAKFVFSENYSVESPSLPFNPYAIDGNAGMEEAAALLSIYPCIEINPDIGEDRTLPQSLNCKSQVKLWVYTA